MSPSVGATRIACVVAICLLMAGAATADQPPSAGTAGPDRACAGSDTDAADRLVGIAYSTWFMSDDWHDTWSMPENGPYRSDDPAVIRRHAAQLTAAGVDFILIDWSNNVDHAPGETRLRHQAFIERATRTLFEEFAALSARPRIAIMLGTSGHPEAARDGRLQRKADQVRNEFVNDPRYAPLFQRYLGKPLLVVYANTPSPYGRSLPWNDDRFTVRWMTGYVTQQPALRLNDEVSAGYWSWEERGRQTYTLHAGVPEAMTVVASWREDSHAAIPARGRRDGLTFAEQWSRVRDVGPRIALVVSWNEWIRSEQPSVEISKDLEPSQALGRRYLDLLAAEIRLFKHGEKPPP